VAYPNAPKAGACAVAVWVGSGTVDTSRRPGEPAPSPSRAFFFADPRKERQPARRHSSSPTAPGSHALAAGCGRLSPRCPPGPCTVLLGVDIAPGHPWTSAWPSHACSGTVWVSAVPAKQLDKPRFGRPLPPAPGSVRRWGQHPSGLGRFPHNHPAGRRIRRGPHRVEAQSARKGGAAGSREGSPETVGAHVRPGTDTPAACCRGVGRFRPARWCTWRGRCVGGTGACPGRRTAPACVARGLDAG